MPLKGTLQLAGDKSISHRALCLAALAVGTSFFENLSLGQDVQSTIHCLRSLGIKIETHNRTTRVFGTGLFGLKEPSHSLNCGNSGTTLRLLAGLLCHRNFSSILEGDHSLSQRPMQRVAGPLRAMGANLELRDGQYAPVFVKPSCLQAIDLRLDIPSAQVKSAILLASLGIEGQTRLFGRINSRDHTERLLAQFGAEIDTQPAFIAINGGHPLHAQQIKIPGDLSSASFWMIAATLIEGSELQLVNVSLNPSRMHLIHSLNKMGASIEILEHHSAIEPYGTLRIRSAKLQCITLEPSDTAALIDEVPILSIALSQAEGSSEVRGAEELRYKESDRLEAILQNLQAMGATLERIENGFRIHGPKKLRGAPIRTFGDHRIAMAFAIASLIATGETSLDDTECVAISYPEFFQHLRQLTQ